MSVKPLFSRRRLIVGALVLLLIALVIWRVTSPGRKSSTAAPTAATAIELLASDLTQVQIQRLQQHLPLTGSLTALQQVVVKSYLSADITALPKREGQWVRAGEVIVSLDNRDAKARTVQANSNLAASAAQVALAQKTLDNNRSLLTQGFIAQNTVDTAVNQLNIAQANYESAQAALRLAQKAEQDSVIRAPMSGIISQRWVQVGEKVAPEARLLEIVDVSQLEWSASVAAEQSVAVRVGQRASLTVADQTLNAQVVRINPQTQSGSRSVLIYLKVLNPDQNLRAGMFAAGELVVQEVSTLAVPQTALYANGEQTFVYRLDEQTQPAQLQRQAVQLGAAGQIDGVPYVQVNTGLSAGQTIVTHQLGRLATGVPVAIRSP